MLKLFLPVSMLVVPTLAAAQDSATAEKFFRKPAVRKMLYVRPVPGTTYEVGSAIYDETVTVESLNKLADGQ